MNVQPLPSREAFVDALNHQIESMDHMKYLKFFLSLYRDIVKALTDFLASLSLSLQSAGEGGGEWARNLAIAFVVLVAIIILVVVAFILRNLRRNPRLRAILGEPLDAGTTVPTLQEKADLLFNRGEFRLAVRYRFIGMLLYLHESNILHHDESMTGAEMVRKLQADGFFGTSSFSGLVSAFNRGWYGTDGIDAEGHARWMELETVFWKEAGRYEKA